MIRFLKQNKTGIILLVISLFLITMGIVRSEASLVLQKAVNICLECIGIG